MLSLADRPGFERLGATITLDHLGEGVTTAEEAKGPSSSHIDNLDRAAAGQIPADRFEFQMPFGARRDAQSCLVADDNLMRVSVPFGTEWYPSFARRIAERPANALFDLRQLVGG